MANASVATPAGHQVRISVLAGSYWATPASGYADGPADKARFSCAGGITGDYIGNIYISDCGNRVIRKLAPDGSVSTFAGKTQWGGGGLQRDGDAAHAMFSNPGGLAMDAAENIYVIDMGAKEPLRRVSSDGSVSTIPLPSNLQQIAAMDHAAAVQKAKDDLRKCQEQEGSKSPDSEYECDDDMSSVVTDNIELGGLTVDTAGNFYVAYKSMIYRFALGAMTATPVVSSASSSLGLIDGMVGDADGNLYVSFYNGFDRKISKISPSGVVSLLSTLKLPAGAEGSLGARGLAIDSKNNLYLVSPPSNTIVRISPAGQVSTLAGNKNALIKDGKGDRASFGGPAALYADVQGNVYLGDFLRDRAAIRKITPGGDVTTLAGDFPSRDGQGGAARFARISGGLAQDRAGDFYLIDDGAIRKITATGMVSTVSESQGEISGEDAAGQVNASDFSDFDNLAVDATGNIYLAAARFVPPPQPWTSVKRVTPTQVAITHLRAQGRMDYVIKQIATDGVVTARPVLLQPGNVAAPYTSPYVQSIGVRDQLKTGRGRPAGDADTQRPIYVYASFRTCAWRVMANGNAQPVIGCGAVLRNPDGSIAVNPFTSIGGIESDYEGNIYVIDILLAQSVGRIRKVTPAGIVTTLAGSAHCEERERPRDGIGEAACFQSPHGITVGSSGLVYVTDADSIRQITPAGVVSTLVTMPLDMSVNQPRKYAMSRPLRGIVQIAPGSFVVSTVRGILRVDLL
jgi:sugar lactone lactonase YvrE